MGVLNVTPDSFYDGGCHVGERAEAHLRNLIAAGAFVIDIG
ncbi:MAG TPA: dihydropteroate synthase, partial [Polyangiaceae bacterium]|nr:dihydropteroate synthase [Polyangiaceae bacterium]